MTRIERSSFVLAVMAAAQTPLSPVQVQKLFFILDQKVGGALGGAYFDFRPYNYGPFDASVYHELEALAARSLVFVDGPGTRRRYGVSGEGIALGSRLLASLPVADYIRQVAEYVKKASFQQLVEAIYKEWPSMRANSVYRD